MRLKKKDFSFLWRNGGYLKENVSQRCGGEMDTQRFKSNGEKDQTHPQLMLLDVCSVLGLLERKQWLEVTRSTWSEGGVCARNSSPPEMQQSPSSPDRRWAPIWQWVPCWKRVILPWTAAKQGVMSEGWWGERGRAEWCEGAATAPQITALEMESGMLRGLTGDAASEPKWSAWQWERLGIARQSLRHEDDNGGDRRSHIKAKQAACSGPKDLPPLDPRPCHPHGPLHSFSCIRPSKPGGLGLFYTS